MHERRLLSVTALAVYIHLSSGDCHYVASQNSCCRDDLCHSQVIQEGSASDTILMQIKHQLSGIPSSSVDEKQDLRIGLDDENVDDHATVDSEHSLTGKVLDSRTWVAVGQWLLACHEMSSMAGIIAILLMSTDDVIWLVPFLSSDQAPRISYSMTYFVTTMIAVGGAWGLGHAASLVQDRYKKLPVQTVMGLVSSVLLALYAVFLYFQWHAERSKESSEASSDAVHADNPQETETDLPDQAKRAKSEPTLKDAHESMKEPSDFPEERTFRQFFIIALVGSLDKLAVYFSMILLGVLTGPRLLLAQSACSLIVIVISTWATYWASLVRVVEKIPLWCIVGVLSIWSVFTVLMGWGK
eukprot:gnl/TRDRNA2_/TRDRNA2_92791_c0_seq1.p1 gnl/TRDRNA2_/TRDRNA2_92791_c0~~gnl/TRDRNA2_/TRDRNA2_92791_c0_seq1.p1  ORF type:complete len:356 (+),score=37.27 gnl/TRDRNA2_/TRDRNA2_92791_c0_seq1:77-1144(+)